MPINRLSEGTLSLVKHFFSLTVGILLACVVSGCGDDNLRSYDAAVLALEDGRNNAALSDARVASRSSTGIQRDRASYVAGVAASRLGKLDEATQYLEIAIRSPQAEVAGKANVQLGYVQDRKGRHLAAARSFEKAGGLLTGTTQARAYLSAADAFEQAGRTVDARRCLSRAERMGDEVSRATAATRLESTGYTIQFGSYSIRENADKRARSMSSIATRNSLGTVQVRYSGGAWKVQAGTFADRQQAGRALARLGRSDAVVMQLGG